MKLAEGDTCDKLTRGVDGLIDNWITSPGTRPSRSRKPDVSCGILPSISWRKVLLSDSQLEVFFLVMTMDSYNTLSSRTLPFLRKTHDGKGGVAVHGSNYKVWV
jgi:hypothetical protein